MACGRRPTSGATSSSRPMAFSVIGMNMKDGKGATEEQPQFTRVEGRVIRRLYYCRWWRTSGKSTSNRPRTRRREMEARGGF